MIAANECVAEYITNIGYPMMYRIHEIPKEKKLRDYMGATPMIIVIKNKKVVYGMVGSISETALTQLAYTYGVSNEEN